MSKMKKRFLTWLMKKYNLIEGKRHYSALENLRADHAKEIKQLNFLKEEFNRIKLRNPINSDAFILSIPISYNFIYFSKNHEEAKRELAKIAAMEVERHIATTSFYELKSGGTK